MIRCILASIVGNVVGAAGTELWREPGEAAVTPGIREIPEIIDN